MLNLVEIPFNLIGTLVIVIKSHFIVFKTAAVRAVN